MVDVNKVSFKNYNLFESLCNKIACLVYSRTDGDKKILNQILDSLNELDYNIFLVKKDRGALVINQCCYLIPSDEVLLSSKAISLFTNLITKAQITVSGKTLSLAVCWCLECLKQGNQTNILKCLQALVKGNGKKIEEDCHQIFAELQKLSNSFNFVPESEETCLNCLRCIEAITFPSELKEDQLPEESALKCFEIFKEILFREKSAGNEVIFCKFLIIAMRGIENLIEVSKKIMTTELDSILGIVRGYMLYGLSGYDSYKVQKIYPSSTTIPEVLKSSSQPVRKLRGKYDRISKKVAVGSITAVEEIDDVKPGNDYVGYSENNQQNDSLIVGYKTSDSDFSDSEFSQNTKIKSYEGKVRHSALILLGKVVKKADPKVFVSYMPSFLPDSSHFPHMRTLTTCLLNDPSHKCRFEVLGVLLTIISNSRQYFLQADGISKSSFIAFSCTISNIIKELHRSLLLALVSEKNNTAVARTLKCLSDLIRCSPYHKMESGLITNVANHVRNFLKHKDVNVQIFALTVFGCIVSIEPKVQEVRDIIITHSSKQNSAENSSNDISVENEEFPVDDFEEDEVIREKPWLFELCLQNLTDTGGRPCDSSTNAALQIESLQVVGALIRNFFRETLVSFPDDVIRLLQHCSNKSEYSTRLYSGKLMETVFNSLQFSFCQEDESKRASIPLTTLLWKSLLPGPVTQLIQSLDEPMLRCTGCDCIANLGIHQHKIQKGQIESFQNSLIFDQLPRDKQILCITLLFGCIRDESPAVRSSAARAMAIFVLFPSLREDSLFFLDAIDTTIACAKDQHNLVRTQASWLLGNLSESIVLNKQSGVDDGVTIDVLSDLLKTAIALASDSPKIKPGAVRGLGNLLQIIDEEFLKKNKEWVVESIDVLIKNATFGTFMKARWNSCYAIANMLQNPLIYSNNEWLSKIFGVMTSLVQHYKNFKVRISAGFVLSVPPTRESYGDLYNSVWSTVLNALENSKNISDFNEYQHRDQLVDQLCLVMCHLVRLMVHSDLNPLQDILYFHLDNLNHFLSKFQERIVPEKSSILLSATDRINSLMDEKGLTTEEKSLIRVLQNLFLSDK